MSKDFSFSGVVSWGRSFQEYAAFFALDEALLKRGAVLDVGGGPASFTYEAHAKGIDVTAVDPVYAQSGAFIHAGCVNTRPAVIEGYRRAHHRVNWDMYGTAEGLVAWRFEALEIFLKDFEAGKTAGRYVVGSLPNLPFPDDRFALALCSHMMFLYSHVLDLDFHVAALTEVLRVAAEARVFPLLTLDGDLSPHLTPAMAALEKRGLVPEIVEVPYEFQKGGNRILRITRS
jgi:hypothetical protein